MYMYMSRSHVSLFQVAQLCQREVRKFAQKSQRASKEVSVQPRARRLMREALMYWRRYERTEKEQRRKAEREAVEQRKIDDEMREVCIQCTCTIVPVNMCIHVPLYL